MVSGSPAIDHRLWLKCCAIYAKLPEIAKAVRKLTARESE
jgi:UDP-3-O-[3-hydroxymyristoyl] glucosamine N-acyltransferase